MDVGGSLTRWKDPILKDAPSPHGVKKAEETVHSRTRAVLLGGVTDMADDGAGDDEKKRCSPG